LLEAKLNNNTFKLIIKRLITFLSAMDAIVDFCEEMGVAKVKKFIVSGASKRGWATWTTVNKKRYRFNF
jgi:PhoPQ-activated pathogenicity-related protein